MKSKLLLIYPILALTVIIGLSGCGSNGGSKGISGGTSQENDMMRVALNDAYNHLVRTGHFPNVKPYSGWAFTMSPQPTIETVKGYPVWKVGPSGEKWIANAYGYRKMAYGRPLFGDTAFHEALHVILERGGYSAESVAHDRRAFPKGKFIK